MKMRKFEYEVSVKICKKGRFWQFHFQDKRNACRTSAAEIVVFLNKRSVPIFRTFQEKQSGEQPQL